MAAFATGLESPLSPSLRWRALFIAAFLAARIMFPKKQKPASDDAYYEIRLSAEHREALLQLLEGGGVPESTLRVIAQRLKAAERYECLPFDINWRHYEDEARKRGESLADFIYDRSDGRADPV